MSPQILLPTTKTLSIINWSVKVSARLRCLPFLLNPSLRRLSLNSSTPFTILYSINRLISFIHFFVSIYLTCVGLSIQQTSASLQVSLALIWICLVLDMAVVYAFWKYKSDIQNQFNGFILFFDQINRKSNLFYKASNQFHDSNL